MSRSRNLFAIQIIDSKLDQHLARSQEIEAALTDNVLVRKAQAAAQGTEENYGEAKKKLKISEGDVRAQRIKIEHSESMLYSGKVINPKELQDLQNEIAALKRFLIILEDRQLENMLAVDSAQEIHHDRQEKLSQAITQDEKKNAGLVVEKNTIKEESHQLKAHREKQWPLIAVDDLRTYQAVRKKRAGIAVTKVSNRACSACGTTLTEVIFRAARSPSKLIFCDTCDRILYTE